MAINKTIFTADRTAQKSEILAWLQANATDYFDEISEDNNENIVCSLENGAKLTFVFDSTATAYSVESKTGVSHTIGGGSSASSYTKEGIVTSKGIMIVGNTTTSAANILIISKTNADTISLSMNARVGSGSSAYPCFMDLINDVDWLTKSSAPQIFSTPITSLTPVCFSYGTHCEHAFFTPFTQFENPCIMQLNGKKYAYGGYLALEE